MPGYFAKIRHSHGQAWLLADKVVRGFYFALLWLGNFKTSGCLVGRLTCAPATTRLTLQLVGFSVESYTGTPTTSIPILSWGIFFAV